MHDFKDNADRTWRLEITIHTVKDLRATLGLDLLDMGGDLLAVMVDDPIALCDMLYVVCRDQAEKDGVSDEDFGRGLRGEAIDAATVAFLEELTDFFPSRRRQILRAALEKVKVLQAKATETALEVLEGDMLDRILDEKLSEGLSSGEESTSSPASPESTPIG